VFADELSGESLQLIRAVIRTQWQSLIEATVPLLEKMIEDDRVADRARDQRLRIGLYSFNETMPAVAPPTADAPVRDVRRTRRKSKDST